MRVENPHNYFAEDGQWLVSYQYDALVAPGFRYPESDLYVLDRRGKIQDTVDLTLTSSQGTTGIQWVGQDGHSNWVEMGPNPDEKVYHLTEATATVAIRSAGKTDTLTLNRQN